MYLDIEILYESHIFLYQKSTEGQDLPQKQEFCDDHDFPESPPRASISQQGGWHFLGGRQVVQSGASLPAGQGPVQTPDSRGKWAGPPSNTVDR